MKLIVGLGNPGKSYAATRHNAGFLVIDELLKHEGNSLTEKERLFEFRELAICGEKVVVAKPKVFMNESGRAVHAIMARFRAKPEACLVVVDDVNLPLGKIRFRRLGSSGSHNGLESIISALGTSGFPRLRIGVGIPDRSGEDLTEFVLGRFTPKERKLLTPQIERARDACLVWLEKGSESVMQQFN